MIVKDLHEWIIAACSNGAVPVITGKNGDMDTVGSAIALSSSRPELIACGLHLGKLAKRLCNDLNAPFKIISSDQVWPEKLGGIIVVDAAAESQIGLNLPKEIPICVIDHHATSEWVFRENDLEVRDNSRSTTQIIFQYLKNFSSHSLTTEVRKLLLAGLITDTGRFMHADEDSLLCANQLIDGGGFEYQEFVEYLQNEEISRSDRGAIIKALNRCKSQDIGDWVLIQTSAGILEGKVASLILQTGGDLSLVSRFRNGETRLTARAKRASTIQGIHLGKMMQELSDQIGGEGGGHDGAAGWSGNIDLITAESAFINILARTKRN